VLTVKVEAEFDRLGPKGWRVLLTQGGQSFRLDYEGNKTDTVWMVKQFRKALAAHDAEGKGKQ
jgi:hypothetical protein